MQKVKTQLLNIFIDGRNYPNTEPQWFLLANAKVLILEFFFSHLSVDNLLERGTFLTTIRRLARSKFNFNFKSLRLKLAD